MRHGRLRDWVSFFLFSALDGKEEKQVPDTGVKAGRRNPGTRRKIIVKAQKIPFFLL